MTYKRSHDIDVVDMRVLFSRLSTASKVVVWAVLLLLVCSCSSRNANPAALGVAASALPLEPPAEEGGSADVPAGWTRLTMLLNDGAISQTVMLRDDAEDAEVQ